MTTKKYLTTPEEVLALRDTDTKIYVECTGGYYKFVRDVLCYFHSDGRDFHYQTGLWMSQKPYILVEEPVNEATENDIGKLCWFWDDGFAGKMYGILEDFGEDAQTKKPSYYCKEARWYDHCRRLTPAEVAEITGYKVEEK